VEGETVEADQAAAEEHWDMVPANEVSKVARSEPPEFGHFGKGEITLLGGHAKGVSSRPHGLRASLQVKRLKRLKRL
jgi:hypothetical protein